MFLALSTGLAENILKLLELNGEVKFSKVWPASKLLSEELPTIIEDSLEELELTFSDISGIISFKGPGSFTGLRIGITVVNAIADQVGVPIVGVSLEDGDDWIEAGLTRLKAGDDDRIVLPEYGRDANITKPRK